MAQQSARRGRENQCFPQCFEHALGEMDQARELPYRPAAQCRIRGRTDGSIRLRTTTIPKFSLATKGGVHRWKAVIRFGISSAPKWCSRQAEFHYIPQPQISL